MEVAERARQLNPRHPGWYWAIPFLDAYRKHDYSGARAFVKCNLPRNILTYTMFAAVYGQLGERAEAAKASRELLELRPDFVQAGRKELEKWFLPNFVEEIFDGLRKAGLELTGPEQKGH